MKCDVIFLFEYIALIKGHRFQGNHNNHLLYEYQHKMSDRQNVQVIPHFEFWLPQTKPVTQ